MTTEQKTYLEEENDLFSRPPRTARHQLMPTARITCRVCGLPSEVPIDNPVLLCAPCRVDIEQTRGFVEETLRLVEERWQATWETFDEQSASVPQWGAIEQARLNADPMLFAEAWRRRKAEGGALGKLLEAREALDLVSDELQRRRAWAESAMREIEAWTSK